MLQGHIFHTVQNDFNINKMTLTNDFNKMTLNFCPKYPFLKRQFSRHEEFTSHNVYCTLRIETYDRKAVLQQMVTAEN